MLDRKRTIELIRRYNIQQNSIAFCADVDPAAVCNYIKGVRVSSVAEIGIVRAAADIANASEKSAPIRPDLSDGPRIKNLIRAVESAEGCCVRCGGQPVEAAKVSETNGRETESEGVAVVTR